MYSETSGQNLVLSEVGPNLGKKTLTLLEMTNNRRRGSRS